MNTTLDTELVGKMIHSNCDRHHCQNGGGKHPNPTTKEPSTSSLQAEQPAPPEFLHSGVWPPLQSLGAELQSHASPPPPNSNDQAEEEQDSTSSDSSPDSLDDEVAPASPERMAATWIEFSEAVSSWKFNKRGPSYHKFTPFSFFSPPSICHC